MRNRLGSSSMILCLVIGAALAFALSGCAGGGGGGAVVTDKPPLPPWSLTVIDSESGKEIAKGKVEVADSSYRVSLDGRAPATFNRQEVSKGLRYVSIPIAADEPAERFRTKDAKRALDELKSSAAEVELKAASGKKLYLLSRGSK